MSSCLVSKSLLQCPCEYRHCCILPSLSALMCRLDVRAPSVHIWILPHVILRLESFVTKTPKANARSSKTTTVAVEIAVDWHWSRVL